MVKRISGITTDNSTAEGSISKKGKHAAAEIGMQVQDADGDEELMAIMEEDGDSSDEGSSSEEEVIMGDADGKLKVVVVCVCVHSHHITI